MKWGDIDIQLFMGKLIGDNKNIGVKQFSNALLTLTIFTAI